MFGFIVNLPIRTVILSRSNKLIKIDLEIIQSFILEDDNDIDWSDINDQPLVKSKVSMKRLTNPKELDKDIMIIRKLLHK